MRPGCRTSASGPDGHARRPGREPSLRLFGPMRFCTLAGVDNSPARSKQMPDTNEIVTLNWGVEHARFEKELLGLVRALAWRYLKRAKRPKVCWNDMCDDMQI